MMLLKKIFSVMEFIVILCIVKVRVVVEVLILYVWVIICVVLVVVMWLNIEYLFIIEKEIVWCVVVLFIMSDCGMVGVYFVNVFKEGEWFGEFLCE